MTLRALYDALRGRLKEGGVEAAAFEADCLLEHFAGLGRGTRPLHGGEEVSETTVREALDAAARRTQGEPLQYLLGEWDFLDLTLEVGEGVLIPRPDTELLCETAADWLRNTLLPASPSFAGVLDLCAGSGCVALGTARLFPGARVTAVELSAQALPYLRRNCARYPDFDVTPMRGDVLNDAPAFPDGWTAILSNPPYIPAADLSGLMPEVQREPRLALDGGGDGLTFYRVIAEKWTKKLAPGGFCAVEVGIGQAAAVAALFRNAGLTGISVFRDLGGIERVVAGRKQ